MKPLTFAEAGRAMGAVFEGSRPPEMFTGVSTDSRTIRAGDLFFAIKGPNFDGQDFVEEAFGRGAVGAVVSRRSSRLSRKGGRTFLVVRDTAEALGSLARYYRSTLPVTVVAVTGSNGKTTTKEMIAHILSPQRPTLKAKKSFNNLIGVPLTILEIEPSHEVAVLELGTSSAGEIAYLASLSRPDVGIVTNISETHLEGLKSILGVALAKAELVEALPQGGLAVLNADDPMSETIRARSSARVITFGLSTSADVFASDVRQDSEGISFLWNGTVRVWLPLIGRYNVYNALAAIAAACRMGLRRDFIAARLSSFKAPPMRMQRRKIAGILIINDAYNANPRSMEAALYELSRLSARGRKIFVCGDMKELGNSSEALHRQLGARIAVAGVDFLVTVGSETLQTADAAVAAGLASANLRSFDSASSAAEFLKGFIRKGDALLIKGSRALGLEAIQEELERSLGEVKV